MTSSWLEQKYVGLLSGSFRNFKVKTSSPYLAQFACPLCGDSKSNKHKARAYIMERDGRFFFYCHNCNASLRFLGLLKDISPSLYTDYLTERYVDEKKVPPPEDETLNHHYAFDAEGPLQTLTKVVHLPLDSPLLKYVAGRKIPREFWSKLYLAEDFNALVNSIIPEKLPGNIKEPRLLIPFLDEGGKCFGFQGRSFAAESPVKYITVMLDSTKPKVWGLDRVDMEKTVLVLEGPLDAMFLPNALAMAGSSLALTPFNTKNFVFIFDNERRNLQIVEKMEGVIDSHGSLVIWPDSVEFKDVNEGIMEGRTPLDIEEIIRQCTVTGLRARFLLNKWRRC